MKDRPPRQHSQALRFLHYSPHYEQLVQQPSVLPGSDLSSEMGPKSHITIIVLSGWREPAYLHGSLSSVNSRCPLVLLMDRQTHRVVSRHQKEQKLLWNIVSQTTLRGSKSRKTRAGFDVTLERQKGQ
ncbi:hypothetical protein AVEN_213782-1 [Araneus ventricosus]|uniref:Uncharacterized protein n=1 Tax=Araneus ventricosus TaxID=182803 RepID=A0A4Y2JA63_ARAVE|nr:hypothetical protein AVEN_213782-1 [Araneus ventricosus]